MVAESDWRSLQLTNDWLRYADTKATAMLAVNGVLFGLLVNSASTGAAFRRSSIGSVVLCMALSLLVLSIVFAALAVLPRRAIAGQQPSLFYWDHVATIYADREGDFVSDYRRLQDDDAATRAQIASQVWACSVVAHLKYEMVNRSVRCFLGALVVVVIAAILLLLKA